MGGWGLVGEWGRRWQLPHDGEWDWSLKIAHPNQHWCATGMQAGTWVPSADVQHGEDEIAEMQTEGML